MIKKCPKCGKELEECQFRGYRNDLSGKKSRYKVIVVDGYCCENGHEMEKFEVE